MAEGVGLLCKRADNLALLSEFISRIEHPLLRKRAIMALWEAKCISDNARELLIEHFGLEA